VILVALAAVAVLGGSLPLVILVLGLLKWDRFVVVMRSATQKVPGARFRLGRTGVRGVHPAHHLA
jgi:ABC-type dipeptide/oligopeptide/nickel transport system permease subunit